MFQALRGKTKKIVNAVAASVLLFSQLAVVPIAHADPIKPWPPTDPDKVGTCHATDSQTNPYTQNDVDKSSIDEEKNKYLNGHGDHTGPTWYPGIADHSWGDIIPPFTNDAGHSYPGQNWDTAGQAIWNNGCVRTGNLKVVKDVVNDNGGIKTYADFTFKVSSGDTPRSFDQAGDPEDGEKIVALPVGTVYTVIEPEANSGGYATTYSAGCTGTIVEGQTQTCTITNDDQDQSQPPQLYLKKVVINDNGGTKNAHDFVLHAFGPQGFFGPANITGSTATTSTGQLGGTVGAGTFTLSEDNLPGYTQGDWSCDSNKTVTNNEVTVDMGEVVTCTITNDDIAPQLTVTKHVVNDNGGTKVASDFTMLVTGTDVSSASFPGDENGTTVSLSAGNYSVSENGLTGYTGTPSGDCSGTIALGEHKYCTITNDDDVPVLTLIKQVLNLNGGTADEDDWKLTATGPTNLSGWGGATSGNDFKAGTYTLSEWGFTKGYSASDWQCVGGSQNGNQITLTPGEHAACTITNYDNPAEIKVTKEVINNNGGKAKAGDFDLWVDHTKVLSGVTNTFSGNEWYFVKETNGPKGYKQTSLKCWDVTGNYPTSVGNPFYAKLGHKYSCKIVNDDIAPKLTIVKDATPNSIQPFSFELKEKFGPYHRNFQLNDNGTSWPLDNDKTFYLDTGFYTVTEDETDGWYLDSITCRGTHEFVNLDARKVTVKLDLGDEVTCKFTNVKFGAVYGFKFDDVNGDGQFDKLTEAKLSGWTITIDQIFGSFEDSTVTALDGHYSFTNLKPGLYKVCEKQQSGWVQITPSGPSGCKFVRITPGDSDDVNFGNFKLGQLTGVKFNDINGNGVRDNNEPTLKDWEITLTKQCAATTQTSAVAPQCQPESWTTKTDATGAYTFEDLEVGTYVVCEVQQANWTQTAPATKDGCVEFTIETSGQEEVVDFGNKAKPQVLGESTLVNTGTSATVGVSVGLTILSVLGALHFLGRRKSFES